jgi:uncharacterized protein
MAQSTPIVKAPKQGRCPICKAETEHVFRPFCSKRCADVDLGKWLTGGYAIPEAQGDDADEDGDDQTARRNTTNPAKDVGHDDD